MIKSKKASRGWKTEPHGETLHDYLVATGQSGNQFAAALGVRASTINRMLNAPDHLPRMPTLALALLIEEITEGRVAPQSFIPPGRSIQEAFFDQTKSRRGHPVRSAIRAAKAATETSAQAA
jgi:transcriptional regulator with XRE-family HTH domain